MPRRALVTAAAGALVTGCLASCSASGGDRASPGRGVAPQRVTASAGPRRSVYLGWSTALAEQVHRDHPGLSVDVLISSGSIENLLRLARREAMLAVASTDAAAVGLRGLPPFGQPVDVMAMARVYDDYVHLMVRDDSAVTRLRDLAGLRVATGPPGSGTALVADRILADQDLKVDRVVLDVVEAGLALQARRLHAVFWLGGLPTRAVAELAGRVRLRMLPLGDVAVRLRARYAAAYRPAAIPASSYGQPGGVPTVASANLLLCRSGMAAELVTAVLTTAFRRREAIAAAQPAGNALDLRAAIATDPVPLHPAAVAYYRAGKP